MRRAGVLGLLLVLLVACGRADRDDYAEVADGEQARRDRTEAVSVARGAMTFLRRAMPSLTWHVEEALSQRCEGMDVAFFGGTPLLRCMTQVTGYAGFDGELSDEIHGFDTAVTGAGWRSTSPAFQPLGYYEKFYGRAEGSRTYDAGNLPETRYFAGPDVPAVCGRGPSLTHSWLEAGQPLPEQSPVVTDGPFTVFRHDEPLDRDAVANELLTAHRYVAVVAASVQCDYSMD